MKEIKRLISIITVLLCVIALNSWFHVNPVFAANDSELVVSSTQGNKGDEVTVKVQLQSNSGLAGLQYSLQYDTSALSLVSANPIENALREPTINTQNEGMIVYIYAEARSNTRTGDLMEVKFKILDGANNDNISLKLIDVMGVDNDVNVVNVKTNVGGITLTGANGGNNNSDAQNNATSNNNATQGNNIEQNNNATQENGNAENNNNTENNNAENNNGNVNSSNDINNTQTDKDGNVVSNNSNDKNKENNSDKKSNKGIIIVVVILIIAVLAGAGYFIYNKKYKNNKDNNNSIM